MKGIGSDFAARLMMWSLRLAGEDRVQWAHAMAAELPHADGRFGRLQWSLSCSLLLFRQWLKRKLTNSTHTRFEGRTMKRPVVAALCTCLALLVGLSFLPEFREGLTVAKALVRNALTSRVGYSKAELARLEQRAEREHNAKLMAYVALHSTEALQYDQYFRSEARERARKAVRMDAQLTWIYARLCNDYRAHAVAGCNEMIRELEAWDPVNSVPYLLEAERLAWTDDPGDRHPYDAPNDPRWYAAMALAFAAMRYDPYGNRSAELERDVYYQDERSLVVLMEGLARSGALVDFGNVYNYEKVELGRNPQNVIDLGRRVTAGGNPIAGLNLTLEGYKKLNEIKPGSIPALQIAAEEKFLEVTVEHGKEGYSSFRAMLYAFQILVALLLVSGTICGLLLAMCGWRLLRRHRVGDRLQTGIALATGAFGFAAVAFWLVYKPFFGYAQEALRNPSPVHFVGPLMVWALSVPMWWNWTWLSLWTWEIVLGLCVIALAFMAGRAIRHWNNRVKPA